MAEGKVGVGEIGSCLGGVGHDFPPDAISEYVAARLDPLKASN